MKGKSASQKKALLVCVCVRVWICVCACMSLESLKLLHQSPHSCVNQKNSFGINSTCVCVCFAPYEWHQMQFINL